MALINTEGIVLRTIKYSDNTVISNVLTQDYGLISIIASKGSKSTVGVMNYLRVLNVLHLTLYPSKSNGIHRVKEMTFSLVFKSLNIEVVRSMYGFVITEVVYALQNKSEIDVYFTFLKRWLIQLDEAKSSYWNILLSGTKEILTIEGIFPEMNYSKINRFFDISEGTFLPFYNAGPHILDEEKSKILAYSLSQTDTDISKKMIFAVMDCIFIYITNHVPNFKSPKSWMVLKEMELL